MAGVTQAESVADHSYGVALVVLALADALNASGELPGPLDIGKALAIAVLHDLGEARLTDLPASATRLIPAGVKAAAEARAIRDLLAPLPAAAQWVAWWQEFEQGSTPEGRLARDADKLEMMVQCLRYEQAGARGLDGFWIAMDRYVWHYALAAELYAQLRTQRENKGGLSVNQV